VKVLPRIVLEDLARSGLTSADAKKLSIEYLPSKEGFSNATEAYRIPYFEPNGRVNGFWRDRFIGDTLPKDSKGKPQRYTQPKGTAPRLYLPPFVKWKKVTADPTTTIFITEGEKKSAALCKLGIPCIGLGGVWNWRADDYAIDDFNQFKWEGRTVKVVFDSDAAYKENIKRALQALSSDLTKRGAVPYSVELPTQRGATKTGVDDFIVHHGGGAQAKRAFLKLPETSLLIPSGYTFEEIARAKLPTPKWAVPGLIPVGLTELAGKPKIGKSWLALDLVTAVANGGKVLGSFPTTQGQALYLALEDQPRRFQDRLRRVLDGSPPSPDGYFFPEWPRVEESGLNALCRWLDQYRSTRLVVIDTLARMRISPSGRGNIYHEDYEAIVPLKKIADDYNVGIVVVHHTRKATADDPLDLVSGSTGLTGAADTILILRRDRGRMDASLFITGRDVTEQELALQLNQRTMRWKVLGAAADYRISNERKQIVDTLKALGEPATPSAVAEVIGKNRGAVKQLMLRMGNSGELRFAVGGCYELAATHETKEEGKKSRWGLYE